LVCAFCYAERTKHANIRKALLVNRKHNNQVGTVRCL
jgi:hypothetical protein